MRKLLLLLILAASASSLSAQSLKDTIDPQNFNQILFEKAIFERVNQYRKSLYKNPLVFNEKVYDAARDHCDYLHKTGKLTHEQETAGKKTVQDRLKKYTGVSRFAAAENVARTTVLMRSANYDKDGNQVMAAAYTYEDAVEYLFNAWRQSEFHRQNMSSDKYVVSAIAVSFDPFKKSITAVQVFARFGS